MKGIWLKSGMGILFKVGIKGGVKVMPRISLGNKVETPSPMKKSDKPITNWFIFKVVVKYANANPKIPPDNIATTIPRKMLPESNSPKKTIEAQPAWHLPVRH